MEYSKSIYFTHDFVMAKSTSELFKYAARMLVIQIHDTWLYLAV